MNISNTLLSFESAATGLLNLCTYSSREYQQITSPWRIKFETAGGRERKGKSTAARHRGDSMCDDFYSASVRT